MRFYISSQREIAFILSNVFLIRYNRSMPFHVKAYKVLFAVILHRSYTLKNIIYCPFFTINYGGNGDGLIHVSGLCLFYPLKTGEMMLIIFGLFKDDRMCIICPICKW